MPAEGEIITDDFNPLERLQVAKAERYRALLLERMGRCYWPSDKRSIAMLKILKVPVEPLTPSAFAHSASHLHL